MNSDSLVWVRDQMRRVVQVPLYPRRIISLVPSQTELLAHLGLEERVVGITKFCEHPAHWRKEKCIVGGTKQIHHERIASLKPDLIIANKEENTQSDIETLATLYPTWVSDIYTLPDALSMITAIGSITQCAEKATLLCDNIQHSFDLIPTPAVRRSAAYLIWRDPWMGVGNDTFIHSMLEMAGYHNALAHLTRYPVISIEILQAIQPAVLLLSSEPYP